MRVTVCQLRDDEHLIADEWDALVEHTRAVESDLVVLPEMPFHPWLFTERRADPDRWAEAAGAHDYWMRRLGETSAMVVLGARPILAEERRLNEAFVWSLETGHRAAHYKRYLPNEDGFWEASWYEPGDGRFDAKRTSGITVGFLLCTELWYPEHAREYGRAGADLIAVPRATDAANRSKWVAGGRTAAVVAGSFCASSNRGGTSGGMDWAGTGWVIDPDGEVLALTSNDDPFVTVEIDLDVALRAKKTYPRYVR